PDYQPDDKLAPLDSPARKAMDEAKAKGGGPETKVPATSGYVWIVDGNESTEPMLPAERASIVLLKSPDGSIVQSRYIASGETPDALVGAAAVATVVLVSAALIKRSYLHAPDEDGLLEGKLSANHTLGYVGYVSAGAA